MRAIDFMLKLYVMAVKYSVKIANEGFLATYALHWKF